MSRSTTWKTSRRSWCYAYGFTARSALFAVGKLRSEGLRVGLLRLKTLWPFPDEAVREAGAHAGKIFVPEMNMGQVAGEVMKYVSGEVVPYCQTDGEIINPDGHSGRASRRIMSWRATLEKHLRPEIKITPFCPGCGHGILMGLILRAIDELDLDWRDMVFVSGIGCAAWIPSPHFKADTLHTLHGRAIAFADGGQAGQPEAHVDSRQRGRGPYLHRRQPPDPRSPQEHRHHGHLRQQHDLRHDGGPTGIDHPGGGKTATSKAGTRTAPSTSRRS